MNKLARSVLTGGLVAVVAAPVLAVPQPQVVENFKTASAGGGALGWQALGLGAEATLTHVPEEPGSLRVQYKFADKGGVLYLLCRNRLRSKPFNVEITCKGDGHNPILGILLREAVEGEGEVFEYRASPPISETAWATRTFELDKPAASGGQGNGQLDVLPGGGGVRLDGLTIRPGPDAQLEGTLEFSEIMALCEVEPEQATMIDVITGRLDGLFLSGEPPQAEILASYVSTEKGSLAIQYSVTDPSGASVGSGNQQLDINSGETLRVPVTFQPRGSSGHYKITATATAAGGKRSATARVAVIPKVGDTGRFIGCHVAPHPGEAQAWLDPMLMQVLKRSGAYFARVDLSWALVEAARGRRDWSLLDHWVASSKASGLPLVVRVVDTPDWARRGREPINFESLPALVAEAARRAGDVVMAWEIWQRPDAVRFWPPEPRPFAYRQLLDNCAARLRQVQPKPMVLNGGLSGFERGFAGVLYSGTPYPTDHLVIAADAPRYAPPFPRGVTPPSQQIAGWLEQAKTWMSDSGRDYLAPWVEDVGVRTSPVAASHADQAAELTKCAAAVKRYQGVMIWIEARDGNAATDRYGLIRRDLEPKPALVALATSTAQ